MTVRITYGSDYASPAAAKIIDFPEFIYKMTPPDYPRRILSNSSASGRVETLTVRADCLVNLGFRSFPNSETVYANLKRHLKQWEQWALYGNMWTIALDSTETVLTTLTSSPDAGDTVFTVTSATGITPGRDYVLRNETDIEVVKVDSVLSLTVTLTEPLNFSFYASDRFRSEMYWPGRLIDTKPIITEQPPLWYDVELRFMEDVNSL